MFAGPLDSWYRRRPLQSTCLLWPLSLAMPKPSSPWSCSQRITPRVSASRSYTTDSKKEPPLKKFHVPSTLASDRLLPTDFIDLSSTPATPCEFTIRVQGHGQLSHPVPLRYAYKRPSGAVGPHPGSLLKLVKSGVPSIRVLWRPLIQLIATQEVAHRTLLVSSSYAQRNISGRNEMIASWKSCWGHVNLQI
ncbi:hypothetical protein FIBSPDRAFT_937544 [Athelia psychrophila]|uniref:Uncharacterized protein n=1 Tax=Athelia psychrophila TaxID=1759441 RepID=A0A166ABM0_9AGAM|nr:hypothetical protein FIBSPDRAFT_937544 [Fibularhizoctonia sp. CBS 109695]